jgi:hypothetical protein
MKKLLLTLSVVVLALTARAATIVFDTFGPGDTYNQSAGYDVGTYYQTPVEDAAQFTAGASGTLATVDLGLTTSGGPLSANVYLYGDASGSPDNTNQIFLGSALFPNPSSIVSFAVAGTVPVTLGSTYWLVLKPSPTNYYGIWNYSSPAVPGMNDYSIAGSGTWMTNGLVLPAFRLTASAPAGVPDSGDTILLMLGALVPLLVLQRKLVHRQVSQ